MVMIVNEAGSQTTPETLLDEEDHDGWGPVRLRRSSMPAPLSAASGHGDAEHAGEPKSDAKPLNS